MGLFRKETPEQQLLAAAVKIANQGSGAMAQGGGGGVETRWRGASRMIRSMASWLPALGSPRKDLASSERSVLVARSRDAMRNHLVARAAIVRNRTSVVGTGLMARPQVDWQALGITEDEGEALNEQLDREFRLWAENPIECDAEATLNHYQLQALALVSALVGGDCFATTPFIERKGAVYGTKIELVETDRVCNPRGWIDSDRLIEGIEIDEHGAPVAFYICNGYPNETVRNQTLEWRRFEAFGSQTGRRRVLQVWADKDRPGQKRGAPYLAPVLEPLQKLERYASAELMAAVVSAMFTVFLKKGAGFDGSGMGMPAFSNGEDTQGGAVDSAPVALGEGAVVDLAPGEEPVMANPARPNAQFDPFFTSIVKEIGAALEIPMEELMLYYSSSYSAARAAMLQAWRAYEMRRWWLVCDFCQPTYELLVDEAVARGRIIAPGYSYPAKRRAYLQCIWIGPAKGAIDELKEAKAARERIDIGVSNETIETAAMTGETWDQIQRQRKRELDRRKRDGTLPQAAAPAQQLRPPAPAPEDEEEQQ